MKIPPYLVFTVQDEGGEMVRKITAKPSEGIGTVNWDLRYDSPFPVRMVKKNLRSAVETFFFISCGPSGKYKVKLDMVVRGEVISLAQPVEFRDGTLE